MKIKNLIEEDFANYKVCSMFIGFPTCTFKCEKDCGKCLCQNSALTQAPTIDISTDSIVKKYISNPLSQAVVCGGLEPFDSYYDLKELLTKLREKTEDDFVIYTGYTEEELTNEIRELSCFKNVIIKFGRFIPDQVSHFDAVLGVNLASNNQYGVRL